MARGFQEVVDERETTADIVDHPAVKQDREAAAQMLSLLLKGLSQKSLIAISNMFTSAAMFSAWWLWSSILPDPSVLKLVGVGMYAAFILAIEIVRRR